MGKIKFDSAGVRENWSQKYKNMTNFPNLKENIKNALYIGEEPKEHLKNGIIKMHRLRNGNEDYLIAETDKGKFFYIARDADSKIKASGGLTANAENTSDANTIITNFVPIVNPSL